MDLLEKFVLPQSPESFSLISVVFIIASIIFSLYLSLLLGISLFSAILNSKRKRESSFSELSSDLINLVMPSKSFSFGLAFIPLLTLILVYTQYFSLAGADVIEFLTLAFVVLFSAVPLLYLFKINGWGKLNNYAFFLLLVVTYIYSGVLRFSINSSLWTNKFNLADLLFSWNTLVYFIHFLTISIAASAAYIYYAYFTTKGRDIAGPDSNKIYVKKLTLYSGLAFVIWQPLMIAIDVFSLPASGLSSGTFLASAFLLLFVILIATIFYTMVKNNSSKLGSSLIYLFIIFFVFLVLKEESSFSTAHQKEMIKLERNYQNSIQDQQN